MLRPGWRSDHARDSADEDVEDVEGSIAGTRAAVGTYIK